MVQQIVSPDLEFRSSAILGGSFINALWHRDLMRLSDRGRASELVGDRWADICALYLGEQIQRERNVPGDMGNASYVVSHIARLDEVPAIAAAASRNQLQNPDFLIVGERDGHLIVQPADAKFSVETAKSKQVSAEVAANLMALGPVVTDHIPMVAPKSDMVDGFFLCPDFSLTHHMMQRRGGPRGNVSVPRDQIELLPIESDEFMSPMAGSAMALWLSERDEFAITPHDSVLAFLYYFRLARACVGCWIDQTAPLLTHRDVPAIDLQAIMDVAITIAPASATGWGIVQAWDAIAEQVRLQRVAIDQATSLPMSSSELRTRVEVLSKKAGVVAPSMSKIRRIVGSWFRSQIREEFGAILPPVVNLPSLLQDLTKSSRELRPQLLAEVDLAVMRAAETAEALPAVAAGVG